MQRIHLAASLSSSLVGTLYVLDEPSIGLHSRDEGRLIEILKELRDLGNTIIVVEHEKAMIESADCIIDMGPGAGEEGGEVTHSGNLASLLTNENSITGQYLTGKQTIPTPVFRRSSNGRFLTIQGARQHNLKDLTVRIPLGVLVCITGVSGSGKSTLVQDVLYAGLKKLRGEWKNKVGEFDSIEGEEPAGGSGPYWQDASIQPGDLHQGLRSDSQGLLFPARGPFPQFVPRTLFVQHSRWPM
jgi:excinuclease ABC subunit A